MSYRTVVLKAGKPVQLNVKGKVILIDDTGAAEGVDITPISAGSSHPKMPKRQKAFKYFVDYDGIELEAADDCTVSLFLSQTDVSLGFASGALVNVLGQVSIANDPDNRVPVDIGGGTVTVTASNVGINNDDAAAIPMRQRAADVFAVSVKNDDAAAMPMRQRAADVFAVSVKNDDAAAMPMRRQALTTFTHPVASVVGTGIAQAIVSDPTLRKVRFLNASLSAVVALGGVNVTLANAAILLQPGDSWIEDDAAGAAWYATSDTAGADVRVMGVK